MPLPSIPRLLAPACLPHHHATCAQTRRHHSATCMPPTKNAYLVRLHSNSHPPYSWQRAKRTVRPRSTRSGSEAQMRQRPQRIDRLRPQGRAHLCNIPLRSMLRASGSSRPLNPAPTARAGLAGFIPSTPACTPRTRAVRTHRVALRPAAASAPSAACGRAARAWGHRLARACSACVAVGVHEVPARARRGRRSGGASLAVAANAVHSVLPLAPLGRTRGP